MDRLADRWSIRSMTTAWARDLDGTVSVVTGASRGIGRAVALSLASAGSQLVLAARDESDLKETLNQIESAGGRAVVFPTDVGDGRSVSAFVQDVAEQFEKVDVLVNNAGSRQNFATIDNLDEETWTEIVNVNLSSVYRVSRAFFPLLTQARDSAVVNVASIAGPVAFAKIGAYSAAKSGVIALTKTMAAEWADRGVRVNAVAPGWIESPMNVELRTEPENRANFESIRDRSLLKRFGRPEEVARLVTFLATERDGYITGEVMFIDGGWTAI
jgi:NAD(P)-dependent dehydrogenase (short-subunit alcohol dehydrogenase family)